MFVITDSSKIHDVYNVSLERAKPESETLEIYTLGRFMVRKNSQLISEKAKRSAKLWELFKFLITNRGKSLPVDNIADSLWPDNDYNDINAALHTLTHRMKRLFFEEYSYGFKPFSLEVSQGCYQMILHENCWVDVDVFADYSLKATEQARYAPESAVELYRKAIELYKGEYLPEYTSKKWVLPAKRHFRQLYLQNLLGKIKIYMDFGQHENVCVICEKAFQVEQFMEVESLHLYFMEALIRSGNTRQALCHYDYLTTSLYLEFGAKPSASMRDLYRKMKPDVDYAGLSLYTILEKMREIKDVNEAFCCDPDFFRFLYNLEIRRSERLDKEIALVLFSIAGINSSVMKADIINEVMDSLEKVLLKGFRKGDVITRWGKTQYLAFLVCVNNSCADKILSRIKGDFKKTCINDGFNLEINRELKL